MSDIFCHNSVKKVLNIRGVLCRFQFYPTTGDVMTHAEKLIVIQMVEDSSLTPATKKEIISLISKENEGAG